MATREVALDALVALTAVVPTRFGALVSAPALPRALFEAPIELVVVGVAHLRAGVTTGQALLTRQRAAAAAAGRKLRDGAYVRDALGVLGTRERQRRPERPCGL